MHKELKVLQLHTYGLALSIIAGNLYARNETDLLFPSRHYSHPVAAESDRSASYGSGGEGSDDEMPDGWKKPGGGFSGTLGEMLIALPLFNQMDREAAEQRAFYIINWPSEINKKTVSIGGAGKGTTHDKKPDQTAEGSNNPQHLKETENDDKQPHDDGQIEHTHLSKGNQCFAEGCNGEGCRCQECLGDLTEQPPAKKSRVDSGISDEKDVQPIVKELSNTQNLVGGTIMTPSIFRLLDVFPDGRMVSIWSSPMVLSVWSPLTLLNQEFTACSDGKPSERTPGPSAYASATVIFHCHDGDIQGSQNVDKSHFVSLLGHEKVIRGALIKQDGRIISWSEDQTIRIWTEQNGSWSPEIIWQQAIEIEEANAMIDYYSEVKELDDGRLHYYSSTENVTLIFTESKGSWSYISQNGEVRVLRDGRCYLMDSQGIRIFSLDKDQRASYLSLSFELTGGQRLIEQLNDGQIITSTLRADSSICNVISLWTEQKDGTWIGKILREEPPPGLSQVDSLHFFYIHRPTGVSQIDEKQVLLWGQNFFIIISKTEGQWLFSNCVNTPIDTFQHDPVVLKTGQFLTVGSCDHSFCGRIWSARDNEWDWEFLYDENESRPGFDHALNLRDGRWVSWLGADGIRVWEYQESNGQWYSFALPVRGRYYTERVVELYDGWVAEIANDSIDSPKYLRVWNVFPDLDNP